MSDLLQGAREAAAEAIEERMDGWGERPVPALPDPAVRPIVPADVAFNPVPTYTPAELAELVQLLCPLRIYRGGMWIVVDCPDILARLRSDRRLYLDDLQDRADAHWRQTGAYAREAEKALAQAAEDAADRRYDKARANRRDEKRGERMMELFHDGYSPRDAQAQALAEFPEED